MLCVFIESQLLLALQAVVMEVQTNYFIFYFNKFFAFSVKELIPSFQIMAK